MPHAICAELHRLDELPNGGLSIVDLLHEGLEGIRGQGLEASVDIELSGPLLLPVELHEVAEGRIGQEDGDARLGVADNRGDLEVLVAGSQQLSDPVMRVAEGLDRRDALPRLTALPLGEEEVLKGELPHDRGRDGSLRLSPECLDRAHASMVAEAAGEGKPGVPARRRGMERYIPSLDSAVPLYATRGGAGSSRGEGRVGLGCSRKGSGRYARVAPRTSA